MPSFLSKNIRAFLVFFFSAVSILLVVIGITRIRKPALLTDVAPSPVPPSPVDMAGATIITGTEYQTPWGGAVASITVNNGKIVAVEMPSVPNSPPSVYAKPYLVDQALKSGSANIQGVSGATYTSIAFISSLESAIANANTQGQAITPNSGPAVTAPTAKPSVPRKYRDDDDGGYDNDD